MTAQQFVYPVPIQLGQQGPWSPQGTPQQAPPQEHKSDDPLEKLVSKYRSKIAKKAAQAIEEEESDTKHSGPAMIVEDNGVDFDELERDELEIMLTRAKKGSREYNEILRALRQRELEDEMSDFGDGAEEVDEITFYNIRVDDISTGDWVQVHTRVNYESKDEMLESVKREHQFATKIKWSKAVKDSVEVPGTTLRIRTLEEAKMNLERATNTIRKNEVKIPEITPPAPPPNLSSDLKPLFEALSNQQIESQRNQAQLIQTLLTRPEPPRVDESEKMMKYMAMMREMLINPMVEMMKVNQPKASDPRISMDLTKTIIESAASLHKIQGNAPAGGDSIVSQLMPYLQNVLGKAMENNNGANPHGQQMQQVNHDLPALGGPQNGASGMQSVQARTAQKISNALKFYVEGKLPVTQLPRWMFRGNLAQDEIISVVNSNMTTFSELVKQAARSLGLMDAYFNRDDVRVGFQWVFEEIQRLATILDMLEQEGRSGERATLLAWPTPPNEGIFIQYGVVGDEARNKFMQEQGLEDDSQISASPDLPIAQPQPQPQQQQQQQQQPQQQQQQQPQQRRPEKNLANGGLPSIKKSQEVPNFL